MAGCTSLRLIDGNSQRKVSSRGIPPWYGSQLAPNASKDVTAINQCIHWSSNVMLMVLVRLPLIMLRLCIQFKVCCGAFRVESCRENTVWFLWSALSHLCTEKEGGKHQASLSNHGYVFWAYIGFPFMCVKETHSFKLWGVKLCYVCYLEFPLQNWYVLEMYVLAEKVCRAPWVITVLSGTSRGTCL